MKGFMGWMILGCLLAFGSAFAQEPRQVWEEFDKRIERGRAVAPLGSNLMGDRISLSDGNLSFAANDVDIPGNAALSVGFSRTYNVKDRHQVPTDLPLADWDLDIPNISGVFAPDWISSSRSSRNQRCSITNPMHAIPMGPKWGGHSADEYWQGYQLNLPGGGGGELLMVGAGTTRPTTGGPYYWIAGDQTYVSCLEAVQNGSGNGAGEGFLAIAPDGTRYWFDWMAQYDEQYLGNPNSSVNTRRKRNVLYASRVEDRFGNWVRYTYTNNWNQPAKLTRIHASDGRELNIGYDTDNHVASVDDGARTWTYHYTGLSGGRRTLSAVVQPDGSQWSIGFSAFTNISLIYPVLPAQDPLASQPEPVRDCFSLLQPGPPHQFTASITHPSGATGQFSVKLLEHGRSNVPVNCHAVATQVAGQPGSGNNTNNDVNFTPISYNGLSLTGKTLTGPGLAAQQWTYGYEPGISMHFYPRVTAGYPVCPAGTDCSVPVCTSDACAGSSRTTVTAPDGTWTRYSHGNSYRYNEGKLLKVETGSGSTVWRTVTHVYDFTQANQQYPVRYGTSPREHPEGFQSEYHRPLRKTDTVQQGATFTWQVATGCAGGTHCFDVFARPMRTTRSSTLPGAPSRTEATEYDDNLSKWVIGQIKSVRCISASLPGCSGQFTAEVGYDPVTANQLTYKAHGKLLQTLTWNADGTVNTVKDGNNHITTLSNWKRGIPQSIKYPGTPEATSGATESAVVNDNGWIMSVTDENGFTTGYDYDAMGRLELIDYPDGDTVNWLDWKADFRPITGADWKPPGVSNGQWRRAEWSGGYRKFVYFDALWQPIVTTDYDTVNQAATLRVTNETYDHNGRQTFKSYAGATFGSSAGVRTQYDVMGRPVVVEQDSELGALVTTTEYLTGFQTRVTPPRGTAARTTTGYLAWDQPTTDFPVAIAHPEGAFTDIGRDAFGKPLSLTRRNGSGSVSTTRNYYYDDHQRLCRSREPESGSTVMQYDDAGNLLWSASGLNLPVTTACYHAQGQQSGRRVDRTYDSRNRLKTLAFPDGLGNQIWTYARDSLPTAINTYNSNGGALVTNTYTYNKRRLLEDEQFAVDSKLWNLDYLYNNLGHLSSYGSPTGHAVAFAPNALGQPTQAGMHATAVGYFPNGGIKQFTYGNGIKHTLSQNSRGLPDTSCDFTGSSCMASAVLRDSYDYDQHGNVAAITDGRTGSRGNRDMEYDSLDRLAQTVSPMFGTASYSYDVRDNIKTLHVSAGPKTRNHTYVYEESSNRLTNVTQTSGGATVIGLGYDPQGNLANRNGVLYDFDSGNRLREVTGVEQYRYDGHGRRVMAIRNEIPIYSVYGQDGTLRFQHDERTGRTIDYVHLGGSLVAQVENAIPLSAPALTVPGSSATGSYNASWTTSPVASKYQLQERLGGADWTTIHDAAGTSKAVSGRAAGVWGYQVRACSATACGTWSPVQTVAVQLPPTGVPTLTVPATGLNGSFTVGWTTVVAADRYQLQERLGTGSWGTVHDAAGTSKAISGKAAGSWGYRVRGCNAAGCGGWSFVESVEVIHAATGMPTVTTPATSYTGAFTVSWTSVTTATRYELEERLGTAAWVQVHDAAATSKAISGKTNGSWGYRARACNAAGCGGWSATDSTAVTLPPAGVPTVTAPASNTTGAFTVSWTSVSTATRYELEERLGTVAWVQIHNAAATSKTVSGKTTGSWGYRARACNVAGCSGWSSLRTVSVLRAPTGAPTVSAPANTTTHNYTVSWTSVPDAARYELEEQVNSAGVWNKVHDAAVTSKAFTGKQTGTYAYRARACNSTGCAGWSSVKTVVVTLPIPLPVAAPSAHDFGHSCSVSWPSSGGATYYEATYAGSVPLYSGPNTGTSKAGSCVSPYHARACNANGCSTWSPPGYHTGGGGGPIDGLPGDDGEAGE